MLKGLDSLSERFLVDLARIQDRSGRVQNQISSGLKIAKPSDAPDRVMEILGLQSRIELNAQIQTNLDRVKAEVDTAEAAMQQAVKLMERANVLAVQTAGNSSEVDRSSFAVEIRQLHDQFVNLTRTSSEGRLIFSGDADQNLLYEADWNQPGGISRLAIAQNTREILDENGGRFRVSKSAHELFDLRNGDDTPAQENVFFALRDLGAALENDDPAGVAAVMPRITAALDHLNRHLSFYGYAQNRVSAAIDDAKRSQLGLKTQLSAVQDTDVTAAILELNVSRTHQEAALAAHARLPRSSLFDYLG